MQSMDWNYTLVFFFLQMTCHANQDRRYHIRDNKRFHQLYIQMAGDSFSRKRLATITCSRRNGRFHPNITPTRTYVPTSGHDGKGSTLALTMVVWFASRLKIEFLSSKPIYIGQVSRETCLITLAGKLWFHRCVSVDGNNKDSYILVDLSYGHVRTSCTLSMIITAHWC